jgi:hypothetical protein
LRGPRVFQESGNSSSLFSFSPRVFPFFRPLWSLLHECILRYCYSYLCSLSRTLYITNSRIPAATK